MWHVQKIPVIYDRLICDADISYMSINTFCRLSYGEYPFSLSPVYIFVYMVQKMITI